MGSTGLLLHAGSDPAGLHAQKRRRQRYAGQPRQA
jgi:hypothetical protein